MQGLGLMGRLSHKQFELFGTALRENLNDASEAEQQVFAQRIYVLKHLAHGPGAAAAPPAPGEGGAGVELAVEVDVFDHSAAAGAIDHECVPTALHFADMPHYQQ